jgi:hypothetical protein
MSIPSPQSNPLIGIWKLIFATAIHADGTVTPDVYGTCPVGYITYTSNGHMIRANASKLLLIAMKVKNQRKNKDFAFDYFLSPKPMPAAGYANA